MIKILIVDDELLVRIGLKSTLEWGKYGFTLVGEAKNAKEAEELFYQYSPDILITDISMPGINGLELISRLRKIKPGLLSIILTHFEDFTYARDALQLGALDYILKSNLTPERLLTVLQKAKTMLPGRDEKSSSGTGSSLPETEQNHMDLLQSYFSDVIKYKITPTNRVYDQIDSCESYQLASIFINLNVNELSNLNPRNITVIEEVSNQILSSYPHKTLCLIHNNRINYLFCFKKKWNRTEQDEIIFNLLQSIMTNLKKILNYYLLAGISLSFTGLQEMGEMHDQAHSASKKAFFEDAHIVKYSPESPRNVHHNVTLDKGKLRALLQVKQSMEIETYINDLLMKIKEQKDIQLFKAAFSQILEQFQLYVDKNKDSDQLALLSSSLLKKDNFEKLYDFAAVKMHILNTLSLLLGKNENDDSNQMSHIIQKSIRYIEQNYNQNISLSNLATNVEVSRNYLSFLFKQELGLNFSRYLTETRIKKAKKILEETNKKIYEVAELVGFDSPYYFSKVFKETTGKTCSEYRNAHYVHESS